MVGDGPAGTMVATLLARAGLRVALFSRGRPNALVVGESLVPAVIPFLRELGIEDEVRKYSTLKPGATFVMGPGHSFEIDFATACTRVPGYAYNVPRERFDATLLTECQQSGAQVVKAAAHMTKDSGDRIRLLEETLAAAGFDAQPDLIVDASGRARIVARLLGLPTDLGTRRDTALFSHCEGVPLDREGHVHSDRLEQGWCWRIPLPGRVSVGIVAHPDVLSTRGETPEAQFDAVLSGDSYLRNLAPGARRIAPVMRYTNYQLTTLRGVGPNWALVGDAFGFIDPVFSSGLYLAMHSAHSLARAVLSGSPRALRRYAGRHERHLAAWRAAISYFYDGTFFALLQMRDRAEKSRFGHLVNSHLSRHLPRVFTGEASQHRYDPWLLAALARAARREPGVDSFGIRDA
ncbi:MAG TPA: NAD(P)/FAD-dependent oxidoreductase [Myxococcota bacterium]|nr:NAD(P)/FAD-dependent oxidoreductase [Myxococcota bacterium]MDP7299251.1 NAD(P)/FAD-dependent oxidoreductase [Myxococcota bacterium]HJO24251.1 NAD(P)/FAD-dependent oxidoreductase [Myxococcota bacterium]